MRNFQLWFELSSKTFARTCDHMLSHHDPDERNYWLEKLEQAESDGHDSLIELAAGKLLAWDCPNCECGCCA